MNPSLSGPISGWIWITWEKHRRTVEICRALEIQLFEKDLSLPRAIKFPYLILWTLWVLVLKMPNGVIVQNPSLVLTTWVLFLKRILKFHLVVDAHNAGLGVGDSDQPQWPWFYKSIQRASDLTIVTNNYLGEMVSKNGGDVFVLEDAIPQLGDARRLSLKGVHNVACITSYGKDEPVESIIEAVRQLKGCTVYMTGNASKLPSAIRGQLPPNLILTGFLSDEEYVALLRSVDLILDLTCRENCLVCGAYEAVAVEKPMVISNTKVLKEHFSKGAVYAGQDRDSIILAIEEGLSRQSELSLGIKALKEELILKWECKKRLLLEKLTGSTLSSCINLSELPPVNKI